MRKYPIYYLTFHNLSFLSIIRFRCANTGGGFYVFFK